jgi:hypothetical protein
VTVPNATMPIVSITPGQAGDTVFAIVLTEIRETNLGGDVQYVIYTNGSNFVSQVYFYFYFYLVCFLVMFLTF